MPYSSLIDLPLELLLVMTRMILLGRDEQLLRCPVPHETVQYIAANPSSWWFVSLALIPCPSGHTTGVGYRPDSRDTA